MAKKKKNQVEEKKEFDFYEAWQFLAGHKMFKGDFSGCLEIDVVKVNPDTNMVDDDEEKNTKTVVWLESGPFGYDVKIHDISLDCGGDTFEEAIITLAGLVRKYHGEKRYVPTPTWDDEEEDDSIEE